MMQRSHGGRAEDMMQGGHMRPEDMMQGGHARRPP